MRAPRTLVRVSHTDEQAGKPKRSSWGIQNWGVRLLYCVIAWAVVNLTTGLYALGAVVAVVLFVVTTAIVAAGRRD